jgi:hypothetical protein
VLKTSQILPIPLSMANQTTLQGHNTLQQHSNRGVGVRFMIALTLPLTGIALVIWTVVQLFIYQTTHI